MWGVILNGAVLLAKRRISKTLKCEPREMPRQAADCAALGMTIYEWEHSVKLLFE